MLSGPKSKKPIFFCFRSYESSVRYPVHQLSHPNIPNMLHLSPRSSSICDKNRRPNQRCNDRPETNTLLSYFWATQYQKEQCEGTILTVEYYRVLLQHQWQVYRQLHPILCSIVFRLMTVLIHRKISHLIIVCRNLENNASFQFRWRSKSELGPDAKSGELIFPTQFDRNLPTEMATSQTLSYYGE